MSLKTRLQGIADEKANSDVVRHIAESLLGDYETLRTTIAGWRDEMKAHERDSLDRWGDDSISAYGFEIMQHAYDRVLNLLDGQEDSNA